MTMVDAHKYEEFWYVHAEDESPDSGDEYSSEENAVAAALSNAHNGYNDQYVVSQVLTRRVGLVAFKFERD